MNAASNSGSPSPATDVQTSSAFAEAFVVPNEHAGTARRASETLGLDPVTPTGAAFLTFLARTLSARAAVEIGTGAGVASLAILEGLTDDGILTSIDTEAAHQQEARKVLNAAGFAARRARLIAGAALTVLPKLSDGAYDLVFVDGDPLETLEYVEQAARLLRPGGALVVNHAFAGGQLPDSANEDDNTVIMREALESVSSMPEFAPLILPIGDGLLVASRA